MKKKQMLAIISSLEESNEVYKNVVSRSEQQIYETLIQCQDRAIVLGNALETKGEEGEALMHNLEDYCECVYQMSLNSQDDIIRNRLMEKMRRLIIQVKAGITYELPNDKREIVFFPYKASMWDAMEGIWKECAADKECVTYVIPIPYYDKKMDGSIKEWKYEGNQYPSYVPITFWEDYDLTTQYPDAIYIHNPYDEYNFVTSVHPQYYSSELKKYTEELIYIPYFVTVGDVPEHLVTVPAVMNADKVIVQSQKVKDSYVKIFVESAGEQQRKLEEQTGKHNKEYWRELYEFADKKFLVQYSSKIQKVLDTKRNNVMIPDEWKKIICSRDGLRKVILYNTTVVTLLQHREKYIIKLVDILNFMEKQKEYVLLWRPHPLFMSTIDAMLPHLSDVYRQIVNQYKTAGWGIFDESSDLHRAIAISDAYFGDMSSVVALYQETGKKIMIQHLQEE